MAVQKFLQRLRSGEAPKDQGRITDTGESVHKRLIDLKEAANIPAGLQRRELVSTLDVDGVTRRFMNRPVYPSSAIARMRSLHLGKTTGTKPLRHPLRGFYSPVLGRRVDA